jgi:hypothetical protein
MKATKFSVARTMAINEATQKQAKVMAMTGKSFSFRLAANCALPAIHVKNWK